VTVLPFRHPVVLAKQIATLDRLSGGRLTVGVGIGAYREEFEAMWPGRRLNRGAYAAEALESLRVLFTERRASYQGSWVSFDDVESHPKPVQSPLPVLSGGNAPGSRRRAATLATG
jgi:alkanesulfonate monooxygenase SsuD/methylene tetrahydromethanopterin reductase-like flavin-dependent oxidoreductase (luciferase family)